MSRQLKDDHLKATNVANLYNTLNQNTQFKVQPQSESDKKKKIWRIGVVKRDDRATEIAEHLKNVTRQNKQEKRKTAKKTKSENENRIIKSPVKIQKSSTIVSRVLTNKPVDLNKKSPYKIVKNPNKLKKDTTIAKVWDLRLKGKSYKEIAEEVGITTDKVGRFIYIRKRQLNVFIERVPVNGKKGFFHPEKKAQEIWNHHKNGLSNAEIAHLMNISLKNVSGTLTRKRKLFNEPLPENPTTIAVHKLKSQNKNYREIASELKISEDKAKYHFYKQKPKNLKKL